MATYLVTGCNRGIGLELVRQLTARGNEVLAVVRQSSEALEATGAEILAGIDVGQGADMAKLKAAVGGRSIDVDAVAVEGMLQLGCDLISATALDVHPLHHVDHLTITEQGDRG